MLSGVEVLEALCRRYAFHDVWALLPSAGLPDDELRRLRRLCLFGQRLLDLDAEDFDMADAEAGGAEYTELVRRARRCRIPQEPRERDRGALATMRPAYALLLEVMAAQHMRHDMAALVATAHMIAEYLPVLVWEPVWGHAADPLRIGRDVRRRGSRFGSRDPECDHRRPDQNAAARILTIGKAPGEGWRAYLDRQHSNVAHALGVCAAECRRPCGMVTALPEEVRTDVGTRAAVAMAFGDSALIRLRHSAPVGHGFGVPSAEEVARTWDHTRTVLARRLPAAEVALRDDGYCLPGLPGLVSVVAGAPIVPDTLLRDTADLTVRKLHAALAVGERS
ncbi:hypothetical protein LX16_2628 [Stackebrandtia albiflava]|uniref:Uncharacterized protein n=1 Tax=Stackebrandtia albiflava TaxID=406432 RepID=A0A562V1U6_9ACTN|nr:hypothetical protein [Stackebrandtia albiflava]TWJ11890.1 hypothetical protein LX16_2628 [Stackebrandtia albiflava]